VKRWWIVAIFPAAAAVLLLALWLARITIAVQLARHYFASHGVTSSVEIGDLGFSGVSGRFALGPAEAPVLSAEHIVLIFDPLRWRPYVTEVRLVQPVVRARLDNSGNLSFGPLQNWIDSLARQQGKSQYVSDHLQVSLRGLRLLLSTPAGPLEASGDADLQNNLPISLVLRARPGHMRYRDLDLAWQIASLAYDRKDATLSAQFDGTIKTPSVETQSLEGKLNAANFRWTAADKQFSATAQSVTLHAIEKSVGLEGKLDAANFRWTAADRQFSATVQSVALHAMAKSVGRKIPLAAPQLDLSASDLSVASTGKGLNTQADLSISGSAGADAALTSVQVADRQLASAVRQNLKRMTLNFAGHAEWREGVVRLVLSKPLTVMGAKGGTLTIPALTLSGGPDRFNAVAEASLKGPGLPPSSLSINNLVWSGGGFTSLATFSTRIDFLMLRGTNLAGRGSFSWQNGQYAFTPSGCVRVALAAFHPGNSDLARNMRGDLCAPPHQPLLTGEGLGWTLTGEARNTSADLPLEAVHLENVAAHLKFDGEGALRKGTAVVTAASVIDRATSMRFKQLAATGTASLDNGVWNGRFTVTGPKKAELGEATFTHDTASGLGSAHINAPHITFAQNGLQPVDLSPLLVALHRAEGSAALTADIHWTRDAITSQGRLNESLDFMTPLGRAHTVKSDIMLTSLLPPASAAGQGLEISRIDWTLPLSRVDVRYAFSPSNIHIDKADTDIAEGHASLGPLAISVANPGQITGSADIKSVSLNALVTTSNLGSKVKVAGKVSGHIPFALTPDGFRITNGHLAADGPGRLSVDRSLWAQGEAAISSNAVQDFAYQALETLAFDQMTADLNSVANGRLQIIFHIKGKSDPPKPQTAKVAVTDILNGTALYKPIPLPSGTAIDLTLDTSLNFDELLKSYAEAWSKSLSPEGHPDRPSGANP
jgi:hypothetical protein